MATIMTYKWNFGELYIEVWWPLDDNNHVPDHDILEIKLKDLDSCNKLLNLMKAKEYDEIPFIIKKEYGSYKSRLDLYKLLKDNSIDFTTSWIEIGYERYDD